MKLSRLGTWACLMVAIATPILAVSQAKMDADDSDVAAMQQKISYAHSEKILALEHSSDGFAKWCKSGKPRMEDQDAAEVCTMISRSMAGTEGEEVLLKGCSYQNRDNDSSNPCIALSQRYIDRGRYIEALAILKTPNAPGEGSLDMPRQRLAAYKGLGNREMIAGELHTLCDDFAQVSSCRSLQGLGQEVDMDDAKQRAHERSAEQEAAKARSEAEQEQEARNKAANRDAVTETIISGINQTAASIQQAHDDAAANLAQARVNIAAAKMAQQNKGAGGYPTTSSGGSSDGGSASGSSKPASQKSPSPSSDTSDATDSSSSDSASASDKPFNPYSSTGGGYNPISGQGTATATGEKGHWVETEVSVGERSRGVPNNPGITLVLTDLEGNPSQYGGYVSMSNSDKLHPFFYGFAGVINERFEVGTTGILRWPSPYLAKNRENPPFEARISIRYWGFD